jgi:hypothetical protein
MRNSGHPGNVPDGNPVFEAAFNNIWPKWLCFYDALVHQPPPPEPDPPPNPPTPTPPLPDPLPPLPPPVEQGDNDLLILGALVLAGYGIYALAQQPRFKKVIKVGEGGVLNLKKIIGK